MGTARAQPPPQPGSRREPARRRRLAGVVLGRTLSAKRPRRPRAPRVGQHEFERTARDPHPGTMAPTGARDAGAPAVADGTRLNRDRDPVAVVVPASDVESTTDLATGHGPVRSESASAPWCSCVSGTRRRHCRRGGIPAVLLELGCPTRWGSGSSWRVADNGPGPGPRRPARRRRAGSRPAPGCGGAAPVLAHDLLLFVHVRCLGPDTESGAGLS